MFTLLRRKLAVPFVVGVAVLLVAPIAQAAVVFNGSIPFRADVFVPCAANGTGEVVALSGNLHELLSFTVNGNNVSGVSHSQPQGVSGLGLTTGDKYQGTGVTANQFKVSLDASANTFTFVNNFRIIGQGPGNNYLVHENEHITLNANGVIAAFVDNFSVDCK